MFNTQTLAKVAAAVSSFVVSVVCLCVCVFFFVVWLFVAVFCFLSFFVCLFVLALSLVLRASSVSCFLTRNRESTRALSGHQAEKKNNVYSVASTAGENIYVASAAVKLLSKGGDPQSMPIVGHSSRGCRLPEAPVSSQRVTDKISPRPPVAGDFSLGS